MCKNKPNTFSIRPWPCFYSFLGVNYGELCAEWLEGLQLCALWGRTGAADTQK